MPPSRTESEGRASSVSTTSIDEVHFSAFVREVNDELAAVADRKAQNKRDQENLTLFQEEARFVGNKTIELVESGATHTGEQVVVAAGSTPVLPESIDGLHVTPPRRWRKGRRTEIASIFSCSEYKTWL